MEPRWVDEYRELVREFVATHGRKVDVEEPRYDWQDEDEANVYGWVDSDAQSHIAHDGCRWVVPAGAVMYEREYSQFQDTDADNLIEHGVNVSGAHCNCGRYPDVILRWTGSVAEMLHTILGLTSPARIEVIL